MRVLPYGDRAVLVEVDGPPVRWRAGLLGIAGVDEVVPAARTVLVRFDPRVIGAAELAAAIQTRTADGSAPRSGPVVTIPVNYDGPDLDAVAILVGCSAEEVVARHTSGDYTVAFCGFAPGFAYLSGLDPRLHVARLDSPRTAVPAGAVAIAGEYTATYPRGSPGGWQLLGRTTAPLWDLTRPEPALLTPGTRVRFEVAR
jgi:5-oxoprolinase (ATP-hydrolysing) subunit B